KGTRLFGQSHQLDGRSILSIFVRRRFEVLRLDISNDGIDVFCRIVRSAGRNDLRRLHQKKNKHCEAIHGGDYNPPLMEGTVRALFAMPQKKSTAVALSEVHLSPGGFEGDFHARIATRRQILMVSHGVLDEFSLAPGSLYENMVIDG